MRIARPKTVTEAEALATLARNHRLLVIVIPVGIPDYQVKALTREVDARLAVLVDRRDRGRPS